MVGIAWPPKIDSKGWTSCLDSRITALVPGTALDFDAIVDRYYADVYRFALSLAGQASDAADLTQETFLRFAQKSGQIRDDSKVKSWLMTVVFREFNGRRRHEVRFPHDNLEDSESDLPAVTDGIDESLDAQTVVRALADLDETFRGPLALFFLEDFSYQEISEMLDIPLGTVMSRLSRGKAQLKRRLSEDARRHAERSHRVLAFPKAST